MKSWLAFVPLMAIALASADCITKSCTEMGCESGVGMQATLAANSDELAAMLITLCKNGVCNTGTPVETRPCPTCPPRVNVSMAGPLNASALLMPSTETTTNDAGDPVAATYAMTVRFAAWSNAERDALKDGDVYTVRVAPRSGGAPLVDVTKSVTYANEYPNGRDCDGDQGYCRSAAL